MSVGEGGVTMEAEVGMMSLREGGHKPRNVGGL